MYWLEGRVYKGVMGGRSRITFLVQGCQGEDSVDRFATVCMFQLISKDDGSATSSVALGLGGS